MKAAIQIALFGIVLLVPVVRSAAHCEVPCGIYDDAARFKSMAEDSTTIHKAIDSIHLLTEDLGPNEINQLGRWIAAKEEHATRIQHTMAQYFMTQRIKPDAANYVEQLTKAHAVMVAAMKCKQSADAATVDALNRALHAFEHAYGGK